MRGWILHWSDAGVLFHRATTWVKESGEAGLEGGCGKQAKQGAVVRITLRGMLYDFEHCVPCIVSASSRATGTMRIPLGFLAPT